MIKSVTATNHLGESIVLELGFPDKSGFLIQSIEGLGPVKANVNIGEVATNDGGYINSVRVGKRNILINLKFLENPTIEDSRQLSYKYFPVKKNIRLRIETDNRICETYGIVEANEPIVFSKSEVTQISILCPDPYLYSIEKTITVFSGIEALFTFPFSSDKFVFSNIKADTLGSIVYNGDADTGMLITMHSNGDVTNVIIYNIDTRETMMLNTVKLVALTGSAIIAGDDIIISTVKGNKYVYLLRSGVYTNILNCLEKSSKWFQLRKGNNIFAYSAETGTDNLTFSVENQVLYGGI